MTMKQKDTYLRGRKMKVKSNLRILLLIVYSNIVQPLQNNNNKQNNK